ncbi:ECs_2282 family putative zinc-binding protein [Aeromonas salmonicida]|uniref:ECs_2282 family putative zinc-binding protein n=1 Tax=Aeromonas salmonicida TaxID=645 RepID=UPI003F7BEECE
MKNDYSRQVTLLCPVCGNSQFATISDSRYSCSDCRTEFDKESLISQNTESTDAMLEDIKKELVADFKKILKGFK